MPESKQVLQQFILKFATTQSKILAVEWSWWPRLSFIADVGAAVIGRVTTSYDRKSKRFLGPFYLGRRTSPNLPRAGLRIQAGFCGRLTTAADHLYRPGTSDASSDTTCRALVYEYRQDSAVIWPRLPIIYHLSAGLYLKRRVYLVKLSQLWILCRFRLF